MDDTYRTHHGYAVNVKDHHVYRGDFATRGSQAIDPDDVLTDAEIEEIYERCQRGFWDDAELLAQEFRFERAFWPQGGGGYRTTFEGVYAEGRMGGWCVPHPQPSTDDMYDHEVAAFERDFAKLAVAIEHAVEDWRETFYAEVAEAIEAKLETAHHNALAERAWRY